MTSVPPFLTWSAEAGVPKLSAPAAPLVEAEPPAPAPLPFCAGVTAEQPAARKPTAATAPTVRPRRVVLGREPRIARNVMELSHRGNWMARAYLVYRIRWKAEIEWLPKTERAQ